MPRPRKTGWRVATGILFAAALALALVVRHTQELPDGPVPIVWDREACAECHMHVGEPRFAAQLQTRDGQVHNFDDPGCLLRYLQTRQPAVHALYLHHLQKERWLTQGEAAFVKVDATPMGYNLGAVELGAPDAISFVAAQAAVQSRREAP